MFILNVFFTHSCSDINEMPHCDDPILPGNIGYVNNKYLKKSES